MRERAYPKSLQTDVTDGLAVAAFDLAIAQIGISTSPKKDIGWDRFVEIRENNQYRNKFFFAQIKGTKTPEYSKSQNSISISIKCSTFRLLTANSLGMLCLCSIERQSTLIYWIWLNEYINELNKTNPKWQDQTYITIPIPTSQILSIKTLIQIKDYVVTFFNQNSFNMKIGEVIASSIPQNTQEFNSYSFNADDSLRNKATFLEDYGIFVPTAPDGSKGISSVPYRYQKMFNEIRLSSTLLNSLDDKKAEDILVPLSRKIKNAPDIVKLKYFNNRAVLYMHLGKLAKANYFLNKAIKIDKNNNKIRLNKLSIEYHQVISSIHTINSLPKGWYARLNRLLSKDKNNRPAIILRSEYLLKIGSADVYSG